MIATFQLCSKPALKRAASLQWALQRACPLVPYSYRAFWSIWKYCSLAICLWPGLRVLWGQRPGNGKAQCLICWQEQFSEWDEHKKKDFLLPPSTLRKCRFLLISDINSDHLFWLQTPQSALLNDFRPAGN